MKGSAPPPDLRIALWCEDKWLPDNGSLLDQDYALMVRMNVLRNIQTSVQRWRDWGGAEIHNLSVSDRRILRMLRDGGMLDGG